MKKAQNDLESILQYMPGGWKRHGKPKISTKTYDAMDCLLHLKCSLASHHAVLTRKMKSGHVAYNIEAANKLEDLVYDIIDESKFPTAGFLSRWA